MRRLFIFVVFCVFCYCLVGCGDDSGSSSSSSSSDNTSSSPSEQPQGGIAGGAGAIGGIGQGGAGGTSAPSSAPAQTQPSGGDFAIDRVAPESLAPAEAGNTLDAGGLPVVLYQGPHGETAPRDIVFLGKFPSTNKSDYTVTANVYDPSTETHSLNVTSVAGDRIVIHFPPAFGPGELTGKMTIEIKYGAKTASIKIYVP